MKNKNDNNENQNNRDLLSLISILLIILIILILLLFYRMGKIGYVQTSTSVNNIDILDVTEKDISWELLETLNIFNNVKFNNDKIIAPGSNNKYSFYVKNTTNTPIVYDLQLSEINNYNINMKYKLKLEDKYICGSFNEWKNIEDINVENIILTPGSSNLYTLEWCWVSNPNDTSIGSLDYAEYTLRAKIGSELYLGK